MNSQQFLSARKNPELAVLEGFHTLKHAIRFGADIVDSVTPDKAKLLELVNELAPKQAQRVELTVREVTEAEYRAAAPVPPRTGVLTIAKRKEYSQETVAKTRNIVVWLDNPKDHENIGAVIRLGAGLGAGAIVATGDIDLWNPGVLRGAAGLHFALPVIKTEKSPAEFNKPIYVFDCSGEALKKVTTAVSSIIVFGSERAGASEQIMAQAEKVIGIPLEKGVSSLNLATSVAIGLYSFTE